MKKHLRITKKEIKNAGYRVQGNLNRGYIIVDSARPKRWFVDREGLERFAKRLRFQPCIIL